METKTNFITENNCLQLIPLRIIEKTAENPRMPHITFTNWFTDVSLATTRKLCNITFRVVEDHEYAFRISLKNGIVTFGFFITNNSQYYRPIKGCSFSHNLKEETTLTIGQIENEICKVVDKLAEMYILNDQIATLIQKQQLIIPIYEIS